VCLFGEQRDIYMSHRDRGIHVATATGSGYSTTTYLYVDCWYGNDGVYDAETLHKRKRVNYPSEDANSIREIEPILLHCPFVTLAPSVHAFNKERYGACILTQRTTEPL
jgi:hypothetical protein